MTPPIDIRADHLRIVQDVLYRHLPAGVKVWVFGSRASWATKDSSDLDLAVEGDSEIGRGTLFALEAAFEDSDLPYAVDIVDLNRINERFRRIVRQQRVPLTLFDSDGVGSSSSEMEGGLYRPTFPAHWARRPLYSMARWVNGLAFRNIEFSDIGKPVIKIAEIKGGISNQTKFTRRTFDDSVRVRSGDLLFSWSGQPETSIDAFWWRGTEGWLNQHVFRVTPVDGIDTNFLFCLLRYLNPNFVAIARNKQTTGLGHVTKRDLERIEAAVPPFREQRAIAHILGTLDDKIELNRRMTATLEAMARALFRSWFVDFDPVRAKMEGRDTGLPREIADLFPDRLVDSQLGEIPEGWTVSVLGDMIGLAYGKALKATARNASGGVPVFGSNGQIGWHNVALVERPGIIVGRKGNPGTVTLSPTEFFPIDTTFYVVPKHVHDECLYFMFFALQEQGLPSVAADSAVPGLNRNLAYMNKQLRPPTSVVECFDGYASTMYARCRQAAEESRLLISLRDTLLPKLVSGDLWVDAAGPAFARDDRPASVGAHEA